MIRPEAMDDFVTTQAGTTETIDVLANDADDEQRTVDDRLGDSTISGRGRPHRQQRHLPRARRSDDQTSFTYTIEDSNGGRGQATVYVTIVGDDPPATHSSTPAGDASDSLADGPLRSGDHDRGLPHRSTIDVLANDTSADGDLTNDTITITGAPGGEQPTIVGQQLRYQPTPTPTASTPSPTSCAKPPAPVTQRPSPSPSRHATTHRCSSMQDRSTVAEDSGPTTINGWASGITAGPSNESAQNIGFTVTVDQPAPVRDTSRRSTPTAP